MKSFAIHKTCVFLLIMTMAKRACTKTIQTASTDMLLQRQQAQIDQPLNLQEIPAPTLITPGTHTKVYIPKSVGNYNADSYKIVHQPDAEPCLSISWTQAPDGSGPGYPRIYYVNGRLIPISRNSGNMPTINRN